MKDDNESSVTDVTEKKHSEQDKRRKALKNILMTSGGVLTAAQLGKTEWAKPVIESVVLPAHAQTSYIAGFSINDPVFLSYTCSDPTTGNVIIDIGGFLDVQVAGIRVRLELTWTVISGYTLTVDPPIIVEVFTAADGTYSSPDHTIGVNIEEVSVVASLPDFPAAGTANDSIFPPTIGTDPYYCAPPTTTPEP